MNSASLVIPLVKEKIYSDVELAFLASGSIPHHIAFIMDGNRRWAKEQYLPSFAGHWKGAQALTKMVRAAASLGVKVLTVYAFSTENWRRSSEEIQGIMDLLKAYLISERKNMAEEGVKLEAIGDLERLSPDVKNILDESKQATSHCDRITLVLALNYGGRDDIRRACMHIIEDVELGRLEKENLSEKTISGYLDTAKWGDPELLIRTSGEQRLSNFLLWQLSYAELHITPVFWPDFNEKHLLAAVLDYQRRKRRLGGE